MTDSYSHLSIANLPRVRRPSKSSRQSIFIFLTVFSFAVTILQIPYTSKCLSPTHFEIDSPQHHFHNDDSNGAATGHKPRSILSTGDWIGTRDASSGRDPSYLETNGRHPREIEHNSQPFSWQMLARHEWQSNKITDDDEYSNRGEELEEKENECEVMAEWQATSYPTCNIMHEIDLARNEDISFRYLGHGANRAAYRLDISSLHPIDTEDVNEYYYDDDNSTSIVFGEKWKKDSLALKMLRIDKEFFSWYSERHRIDAVAMERLTFSPYVINIYGYCGQSAINELAESAMRYAKSVFVRSEYSERISKRKLKLAYTIASGISHVHSIDYPDYDANNAMPVKVNATMVYNDLNPRNVVLMNKRSTKLSDFNIAQFITWNRKTNSSCDFTEVLDEPWYRSPEEMFHTIDNPVGKPLTEKIDIYSLGNMFFFILTGSDPRGNIPRKERRAMEPVYRPIVARGDLPTLPDELQNSTDPAIEALRDAMWKCLRPKPEDRPSAGEIASELKKALDSI